MSSLSSVKSRPEMTSSTSLRPVQVVETQEDQPGQAETTSTSSGSRRARRIQPQKESPIDAMPIEVLCQIMMFDPRFRHRKVSRQFQRAFDYMAGLYWGAMKGGFPEGGLAIRSRIDAIEQEPGLSDLQKSILLQRQIVPFGRGVKAPLNRWFLTLPQKYFQIQSRVDIEEGISDANARGEILMQYPHLKIPESPDELKKWGEEVASAFPLRAISLTLKKTGATRLPEVLYHLPQLQGLSIRAARSLVCLSSSLGNLTALEEFSIRGAQFLTELPNSFANLSRLQKLKLTTCPLFPALPSNLSQLEQLRSLHLSKCRSLKEIPESIGALRRLEVVVFEKLFSLKKLPETMQNLTHLHTLEVTNCPLLEEIPSCLNRLTRLAIFRLWGCVSLRATEVSFSSDQIRIINISDWKALKRVTFASALPAMQFMSITGAYSLEEIYGLEGELPVLTYASFMFSTFLNHLPDLTAHAPSLEQLDLRYCPSLKRLPDSLGESPLRRLDLEGTFLTEASPRLTHSANKVVADAVLAQLEPKVGIKREREKEEEQVPPKRSKHDDKDPDDSRCV